MGPRVLIDGTPVDTLSAGDRGLHYGDGLFETVLVRAGRPLLWDRHLGRLLEGCRRLGIHGLDADVLSREAEDLCRSEATAVLKLIVTRGAGERGYRPSPTRPTRILFRYAAPAHPAHYREQGVAVRYCSTPLARNPLLAGLKHLNRLEQVLARAEWDDPEIAEGLMCDDHGRVVEGTATNLFLVRDGRLITPRLDECGVAGVIRARVLDLAAEVGLVCVEADVSVEDVHAADELFLTNSLIGLWPVRRVEGRGYRPGPITATLAERLWGNLEG